jgi:putative DNA primase/helicase
MTDLKTLWRILGGSISSGQLLCPGPGHSRHDRSLAVRPSPSGFVVYSHAGDDWRTCADYVRERLGLPQWQAATTDHRTCQSSVNDDRERIERAQTIWDEAHDPHGTVAEEYLGSRRLDLPPELRVFVLRFHPTCPWESGTVPCLVAAFRAIDGDALTGIHRIRLDRPERWPKAERKMLGSIAGSAVKLDPAGDRLAIGEGIETCMAARQLGLRPVWALGSAGAIARFPDVANVEGLTIVGENDGGASRHAAEACRDSWHPRRVAILTPTGGRKDFNDLTLEETK